MRTSIKVEIFKYPTYFSSYAESPYRRHRDPGVYGMGQHKDKETSIILAIDNLYSGMREYNEHIGFTKQKNK